MSIWSRAGEWEHALGTVPYTVQIVGHEVDPVNDGGHLGQVEVLEVPVGRRRRKCEPKAVTGS